MNNEIECENRNNHNYYNTAAVSQSKEEKTQSHVSNTIRETQD